MVLNFKQIYSDSWDVFKKNWWEFAVVTIIMGILTVIPLIGNILQLFLYFAVLSAILKSVRGETISFSEFFNFKKVFNAKVISIFVIIALITLLSVVLQAIARNPFATIILSLTLFILTVFFFPLFCVMLDKEFNVKETFLYSLQLTKGARVNIVIIMIINFVIGMVGIVLLFLGLLVAIPIVAIATVQTYKALELKSASL